jgi:hypothetical protein
MSLHVRRELIPPDALFKIGEPLLEQYLCLTIELQPERLRSIERGYAAVNFRGALQCLCVRLAVDVFPLWWHVGPDQELKALYQSIVRWSFPQSIGQIIT